MTPGPQIRVLFRVAAGPRLGYGHLVRARVLSRALGLSRPAVVVRGPQPARAAARRLGMTALSGAPAALLARLRPDVLVLDDPSATAAAGWCRAGQGRGVPVVSLHDLGLAFCGADLSIDGSLESPTVAVAGRVLRGTRYTVLDPAVGVLRRGRQSTRRILIALGGGPRPGVAGRLASAIRRLAPDAEVRIAGGFAGRPRSSGDGVRWLGVVPGLAGELAGCAVAVTAGGVTMYEAAALRTPVVAWPVVAAQLPAVNAFARHHLAIPVLPGPARVGRAAEAVLRLLPVGRIRPATAEARALDGRGAGRVAAEIRRLARRAQGRAA